MGLEITQLNSDIINLIKYSHKIVHHIHIPLQSGSNRILKLMNRHYDKEYFMIKEGSWGDYYAARVELWYMPISGGEPQLLNTAIYKIEGWSR